MSESDSQSAARGTPVDELVLVVHGVGDPQPGETLSLFARSVADTGSPLTETQEILWLTDEGDNLPCRDVNTFPCHTRHLSYRDGKTTLSEIYWGDMSRVHRGIIGIVTGLVSIIFGLRYVAFVAAEQKGVAAKGLQALGVICSRMLHGPVLAVNFVLAMMFLTVAGTETMWPGSSQQVNWAAMLVFGCGGITLLASFVGRRMTASSIGHRFWYWVSISAMFLIGVGLLNVLRNDYFPLANYCNVMVTMLAAQWIALVFALLAMACAWFFALFERGNYRPALHVALILPALAVGIWGQMLPLAWISGSTSLNRFLTPQQHRQDSALNNLVLGLDSEKERLWPWERQSVERVRHAARQAALKAKRAEERLDRSAAVRSQLRTMFRRAVPLTGLQFILCVILGVAAVTQLVRYIRWSEKADVDRYLQGRRAPRLIVADVVQWILIAGSCGVMMLILYFSANEFLGYDLSENVFAQTLVEANKYAIGFVVPIGGLLALSLHYLRPGLDIVLDIVSHFYFRAATRDDYYQSMDDDYDLDDVTFNGGEYYFSRRDAIHRRMKRILNYYRDTLPGNPMLTVVSHSQGSMVAIEVLNDEELDWINNKFRSVNLVTMGSPFHHIYQQYFAHFYPQLTDPKWQLLRERIHRWVNIFRVDDYVGTEIAFPESMPEVKEGRYGNHPVERRGHVKYWCDRQVLEIIHQNNICWSMARSPRMDRRVA